MYIDVHSISVVPGELIAAVFPTVPVDLGDTVTLICATSGGPDNMFQWQRKEKNIPGGQQSTLELNSVSATDGGVYTCVVSNAAGNDSISTTLYIRPYFTTQPMSISTEAGQNETLTCEAEGFPEPTIQWFRADRADYGMNVAGMNASDLMFTPVQFRDEGGYYCTATSNQSRSNSSTAILSGKSDLMQIY